MVPQISQIKQLFLSPELKSGSKSTPLRPLLTSMGILLSAIVLIVVGGIGKWGLDVHPWLINILIGSIVFSFLAFGLVSIGAFIFLLRNNPDALQSESFMIGKLAMQKELEESDRERKRKQYSSVDEEIKE